MGYSTQEQEQFLFKVHDWFRSDVRRGTGTETIWRTERRTWVKDLYYKGLFSGILDILERSLARCLVIKHLSLWRNLKEPWKGLYHLTTWDIVYFCLFVNWREKIRTELPTIHWDFKVALKLSVVFFARNFYMLCLNDVRQVDVQQWIVTTFSQTVQSYQHANHFEWLAVRILFRW